MSRVAPVRDPDLIVRLVSSVELDGVRAGSALRVVGDRLLVVGDDAHVATWVEPASGTTRHQVLAGDGARLEKPRKPDFEAAAVDDDGSLWLFGSGSLSNRWLVTRLSGASHGQASTYDASGLYDALGRYLGGAPNLEGALLRDGVLTLCHRATGASPDQLIDLPAPVLRGGTARVLAATLLEPALLDGVPAHVTDLAALPDGRTAYLAAAEETDDPVADGLVAGTCLGVIDGDRARWTPIIDLDGSPSRRKAEGLVVDPDGRGGWLVTDRDDPSLPAELCRFGISGL